MFVMREQVWQLNSLLLVLFIFIVALLNLLLEQKPPKAPRALAIVASQQEAGLQKKLSDEDLDSIYQHDLFDTFAAQAVAKQALINPIPEPDPLPETIIPPVTPPPLLPQLNITLKGIMFSSNPEQSAVLLTDETQKEKTYFVGDAIRDGNILKIARNCIVILRSNGQQETVYLKKDDSLAFLAPQELWENTVKKVSDTEYIVDPYTFTENITSLGQLLEDFMVATAYKEGNPIGLEVGAITPRSLAHALGFKAGDFLIKVNEHELADTSSRYKAYEDIISHKGGGSITVESQRNSENIQTTYKLARIEKELKPPFFTPPKARDAEKAGLFKMSSLQQHDHNERVFKSEHNVDREEMIQDMRQRIIDSIKEREQNRQAQ
jgi:type II secretion system protein C